MVNLTSFTIVITEYSKYATILHSRWSANPVALCKPTVWWMMSSGPFQDGSHSLYSLFKITVEGAGNKKKKSITSSVNILLHTESSIFAFVIVLKMRHLVVKTYILCILQIPKTLKMNIKRWKYCSRQSKITVHDAQNIGRKYKYWYWGLYECISEGNWLSSEKFRWHFIFLLPMYL